MCQPNSQLHHLAGRLHHLSTQGPIVPVSRWYQSMWALECFTLPKTQNVRNCLSQRYSLPTLIQSLQLNSELSLWPIDKYKFNYRYTYSVIIKHQLILHYGMIWQLHNWQKANVNHSSEKSFRHLFACEGRQLVVPGVVYPRPALAPNCSKRLNQNPLVDNALQCQKRFWKENPH